MDRRGVWSLAPAYDVAFAYNPSGAWTSSHQMTISGKRRDIQAADFDACAKIAGLTNAQKNRIFRDVNASIEKWPQFAEEAGVADDIATEIKSMLQSV